MVMALLLAIPMVLVDDDDGGDTGCVLHRCTGVRARPLMAHPSGLALPYPASSL